MSLSFDCIESAIIANSIALDTDLEATRNYRTVCFPSQSQQDSCQVPGATAPYSQVMFHNTAIIGLQSLPTNEARTLIVEHEELPTEYDDWQSTTERILSVP